MQLKITVTSLTRGVFAVLGASLRPLRLIVFIIAGATICKAQNKIREQLDQERATVGSFLDSKMYEKARSFIRRDSTYYVGYLLEGGIAPITDINSIMD
jgi:hypothetical protein